MCVLFNLKSFVCQKELDAEALQLSNIIPDVDPQACTRLLEVHENLKKLTDLCLWYEYYWTIICF